MIYNNENYRPIPPLTVINKNGEKCKIYHKNKKRQYNESVQNYLNTKEQEERYGIEIKTEENEPKQDI